MLVLMLLAVYVALRRDARVQTIRIRGSNAHPELTLGREEVYHTFNSHIWSTGQDQAATIKRQLQRLLPEVRVFLGAFAVLTPGGELFPEIARFAVRRRRRPTMLQLTLRVPSLLPQTWTTSPTSACSRRMSSRPAP